MSKSSRSDLALTDALVKFEAMLCDTEGSQKRIEAHTRWFEAEPERAEVLSATIISAI